MNYTLQFLPRAEKQLSRINSPQYDSIKAKIFALCDTPRPPGCKKLRGHEGWRIRIGDYRAVYEIDDDRKVVIVLKIGHRSEIY